MSSKSFLVIFLSLATITLCYTAVATAAPKSDEPARKAMWDQGTVQFFLGQDYTRVPNQAANTYHLKNTVSKWNNKANIQVSAEESPQCVMGDHGRCMLDLNNNAHLNRRNEIHFNPFSGRGKPPRDSLATTYIRDRQANRRAADGRSLFGYIVEADIFMNPNWPWNSALSGNCPRGTEIFEVALLHEMGHALGLMHGDNPVSIMYPTRSSNVSGCEYKLASDDIQALRNLYGPADPVQVAISQPRPGQTLYAGGHAVLQAQSKSKIAHEVEWSVEGGQRLGRGGFLSVPVEDLGVGEQSIVATAIGPDGRRLGSDSVHVEVVDRSDSTLDWKPLPCIREYGTDRCLLQMELSTGNFWRCTDVPLSNGFKGWLYNDSNPSQRWTLEEPRTFDWSPWGFLCDSRESYSLGFYRWLDWPGNSLNLIMVAQVWDGPRIISNRRYGTRVDFVDPVLRNLTIPDQCTIESGSTKCAIEVSWSGLYFAPKSALFYRPSGGQWSKVAEMGFQQGTVSSGDVVGMDGGQFAIFQYGRNVTQQDIKINSKPTPFPYHRPRVLINAPSAMMAGPFDVSAEPATEPPSVSIVAPDDGVTLTSDEVLTIRVSASSSAGSIERVEIYLNGTKRHTLRSAPYIVRFSSLQPGHYLIEAKATDSNGITTRSSAVEVTVTQAASGNLTTDSPCTLNSGSNRCSVQIAAQKSNTPVGCIWLTGPTQLYSCSASSTWTKVFSHVTETPRRVELRAHDTTPSNSDASRRAGHLLDAKTVRAIRSEEPPITGSISGNNVCSLPGDESPTRCTVRLTAHKQGAPVGCLWLANPTNLFSCGGAASWTADFTWARTTPRNMELRAHDSYPANSDAARRSGVLLDAIQVRAR